MGNTKILDYSESDGKCSICKEKADLRPYGPGGAWVCFECGMKDEKEMEKQFGKILEGVDTIVYVEKGDDDAKKA